MRSSTFIFLALWSHPSLALYHTNVSDYDYGDGIFPEMDFEDDTDLEYDHSGDPPPHVKTPNISIPTVEVYRHTENSEKLVVLCRAGTKIYKDSCWLVIRSGENVNILYDPACFAERGMCMFYVTVSASASFTCEHLISLELRELSSEAYFYHPQKTSSSYIAFASIIGVCLIIMVIIVIKISHWAKQQESLRTGQDVTYDEVPV